MDFYPQNTSEQLSLDEVALSAGKLYTVLTSKKTIGRKGPLIAVIKGTQSGTVIENLLKINRKLRMNVKEVTLDMTGYMKLLAKKCFPNAALVIDRFHVQKLATETLQEIRIKHRWKAIEQENNLLETSKYNKRKPEIEVFENGDTRRELLARSRYLLIKPERSGLLSKQRAEILFLQYPDLEKLTVYQMV